MAEAVGGIVDRLLHGGSGGSLTKRPSGGLGTSSGEGSLKSSGSKTVFGLGLRREDSSSDTRSKSLGHSPLSMAGAGGAGGEEKRQAGSREISR